MLAAALVLSGSSYAARDLPGIVDPKPSVRASSLEPGDPWIFPVPAHAPAFTLRELLGERPPPQEKAVVEKLRKAGFQIGRHRVWEGRISRRYAKVVVFAFLFREVSGAHEGFGAIRASTRFPRTVASGGLGDESVGLYGKDDSAEVADYLWRRNNLVIEAEIGCEGPCGFPVLQPARAYAGQIDARAKRKS